ncbi:MAG: helix-turn-helix transcriptional regulator [Ruminococcus sp.]|nr:helix-turn-helix transcriptional regulator [Ruminococcus sp.]
MTNKSDFWGLIMTVNQRIKEIRINRGFTQVELSNALHCSRQKIADWEREKTQPSTNDIINISRLFDISTDYILGLSSTEKNNVNISDYTGLTDRAIRALKNLKSISDSYYPVNYTETINIILENCDFQVEGLIKENLLEYLYYFFCAKRFIYNDKYKKDNKKTFGEYEEAFMEMTEILSESNFLSHVSPYEAVTDVFIRHIDDYLKRMILPNSFLENKGGEGNGND